MTRPSGAIERPIIKVAGANAAAEVMDNLLDARVELAFNRPNRATLRFDDREFDLLDADTFSIGAALIVGFGAVGSSDLVDVFTGEIVTVGVETGPGEAPVVVVTAYDKSHRLGRTTKHRTLLEVSGSDVIRTILGEAGITAGTLDSKLSGMRPHRLQSGDDAAFLAALCAATGTVWTMSANTMKISTPATAGAVATLTRGQNVRRFRARFSASDLAGNVTVRGWDVASKAALTGTSSSAPASLSTSTIASDTRSAAASSFPATKVTSTPVVLSADEATKVAGALHARSMSEEASVRGEADGNPAIVAGVTVALAQFGTRLSGDYVVTSVEHVYSGRDYVTRFECGGLEPASLVDLVGSRAVPGGLPGRPGQQGLQGPTIGLVTNIGSGGDAGKVKVKLPAQGDTIETGWARVVSPGAGATRGLQLMPSVDDEVLVVFEHGDPTRPYVLGGLWSPVDALPQAGFLTDGAVVEWVLKTLVGHTMTFRNGDADNNKNVEFLLADGTTKLFLGQDKVELWANQGKPLQLKSGDGSITITANGDIEIKGAKITITGTGDVAMEGMNVTAKSKAAMTVQGGSTVEVKASASAKVDGGGMTEIKGGMVKVN